MNDTTNISKTFFHCHQYINTIRDIALSIGDVGKYSC